MNELEDFFMNEFYEFVYIDLKTKFPENLALTAWKYHPGVS